MRRLPGAGGIIARDSLGRLITKHDRVAYFDIQHKQFVTGTVDHIFANRIQILVDTPATSYKTIRPGLTFSISTQATFGKYSIGGILLQMLINSEP